ncbi:hypothetical protein WICMUC_000359 [Wickerhamomyces mucosus]|uniref:Catabolic 3-dehydroquinase n=1 Tax=Wickerhamomyces mucosus TaxID=1378264 RepID=A0A9P8PXS2_9ASCO|nr:hypothetical protein WICMUC_000359 [Wickerhamomyces mucosus]
MVNKILLLHGPNLNLLGTREPEKYGSVTLPEIETASTKQVNSFDASYSLSTFQSNTEGSLIDRIHQAKQEGIEFIIINAGAYTHTSVAIRDALLGVDIPFIEIHITNVHAREEFRHKSYLADKAIAVISGLGPVVGYRAAIDYALNYQKK